MRVRVLIGLFLFLLVATATALYWIPLEQHTSVTPVAHGQPLLPMTQLTIGATTVTVELATTADQQEKGLSDRPSLGGGHGMLFVFTSPTMDGFWMKDMRFPIDIIWADSAGVIVTIYQNLSPDTYPQAFHPTVPATYVLEVPAGYAAQQGIAVGGKFVVQ